MFPTRTLLVPTDFSEPADQGFRVACSLARSGGGRLIVLHVAEPPPFITPGELEKLLQMPDGYRQELETKLHRLRPDDSRVTVEYRLTSGDPVVEILHAAKETGCDLIVMGTHGLTGFRWVFMGSVAATVVRKAPCPVLTVKVPEEAQPAEASAGHAANPASP